MQEYYDIYWVYQNENQMDSLELNLNLERKRSVTSPKGMLCLSDGVMKKKKVMDISFFDFKKFNLES